MKRYDVHIDITVTTAVQQLADSGDGARVIAAPPVVEELRELFAGRRAARDCQVRFGVEDYTAFIDPEATREVPNR